MFHRLVSAQAVVNGGDLRQRKIRERDALVIGRKQNDVRELVANLADNLEQDCVLCVCHGSTRDPFRSSKSSRLIGLTDPSRAIFWTEHSGHRALLAVATAQQETTTGRYVGKCPVARRRQLPAGLHFCPRTPASSGTAIPARPRARDTGLWKRGSISAGCLRARMRCGAKEHRVPNDQSVLGQKQPLVSNLRVLLLD